MIKTPPHTKVRTTTMLANGDVQIDSHSTYTELSSTKQEIQRTFPTSRDNLAADLIRHTEDVRNGEVAELSLQITCDKRTGEPNFIIKSWTVSKEYYGRVGNH